MTSKAVVLSSGGMDSTTALAYALDTYEEVRTISFDYGQRHQVELEAASAVAEHYNVKHDLVDLTSVTKLISTSALTSNKEVPEGHYEEDTMRDTVVPNRNAMMSNIAIAAAVSWGAEAVVMGIHAGDHAVYPDCRPEFVEVLEECAKVANEDFIHPHFHIDAPFVKLSKADIVDIGLRLGVPYELTWTCYKGGMLHCGKCSTCVERLEAFDIAGVIDPVTYEDRHSWRSVIGVE